MERGIVLQKKIVSILTIFLLILSFTYNNSFVEAAPNPNPIKIVIDPGHGGQDSGAIGVNGIYEKDVNLDISLRLKEFLVDAGYQVILTREEDRTLVPYRNTTEKRADLQARVDVATYAAADLFVSIHANYYKSNSQGALILYYDPSNYNPSYQATVQMKQWSMESKKLGTAVLNSITNSLGLKNQGVQPSNVYVVRSGTVPSILVETAFLSNQEEAAKLADPIFRQSMAEAIAAGIIGYSPLRFLDIRDHWAKQEIASLSYLGIINGYQDRSFKPYQEMTRAEWVTLLDKALGLTVDATNESRLQFIDIDETYWAYEAIMRVKQSGIVTGYNDGTFRPNQVISREEMAVTLYRALLLNKKQAEEEQIEDIEIGSGEGVEDDSIPIEVDSNTDELDHSQDTGLDLDHATVVIASQDDASTLPFVDVPVIHWSTEAISALYSSGVIRGIQADQFGLGKKVTRGEAATLIYRVIN